MSKFDKIRAHREALKHAWFNFDHSKTPEVKQITVTWDTYPTRKGYATIKIVSDTSSGYCSFSTHQQFPIEYLKNNKEYKSGEYEVIFEKGERPYHLGIQYKLNTISVG